MREAEDTAFEAYAAARWAPLVRVAALLGTPDHLCGVVARAALARTRTAWAGRDPIDPDLVTCRALVDERALVDVWWLEVAGPIAQRTRESAHDRRRELESRLDQLTVDDRAALLVGALMGSEDRVRSRSAPRAEEIRAVAETIRVEPFVPRMIAETAHEQTRARRRRSAPALIAVTTLAAGLAVVAVMSATAGNPDAEPRATDPAARTDATRGAVLTESVPNPAPVPWYAEGSLHLEQSTLEIPTVRRAAQFGNGAVVLTYAGDLMLLDDAGTPTQLADLSPLGLSASFVASNVDGLVAWVEAEPDPDPVEDRPVTLIVRDTTRRIDLLRMMVDRGSEPVAVDSRAVFFNQADKSVRIALGAEEYLEAPRREDIELDPRRLVAAAGPSRVYQVGNQQLEVERSNLGRVLELPGTGGELTDDGRFFSTRTFDDQTSAYGDVRVYELPSGEELPSGIDPDLSVAVDVELGRSDTISYLLAEVGQASSDEAFGEAGSPRLDLLTCNLSDRYLRFAIAAGEDPPPRCAVQARVPTSSVATFLGQ